MEENDNCFWCDKPCDNEVSIDTKDGKKRENIHFNCVIEAFKKLKELKNE